MPLKRRSVERQGEYRRGAGEEVLEEDVSCIFREDAEDIFGIHRSDCERREGLRSASGGGRFCEAIAEAGRD
jgi:hypothetical protein